MATNGSNDKWYFTKEQLDNTPSRKAGYDSYKELSYRQQTANFIQDMGQRLKVSQLCINTAIVYMHRFYVFHSFTHFPWHQMAAAALFLAAKVEEQPRKLEYVIRVANMCRNNRDASIEPGSERYLAQSQDLVFNENVLLQTLGFDVAIDHPHTHVVRCCHLVRASKDLAQSSYFLANNSLHLTTMCLQYKPTVVACFCIYLACKWSSWEIPLSTEKKEWFLYVDPTVTAELLQQLTAEYLIIFESCPSRLKEKIVSIGDNGMHNSTSSISNSPFDTDPKKVLNTDQKEPHPHRSHDSKTGSEGDPHKHRSSRPHGHDSTSQQQREREYRDKKEREKLAQQQHAINKNLPAGANKMTVPHGHHRPVDPKLKQPHSRPPSTAHRSTEPRDILREAASRDSPFGIATKEYSSNNPAAREHNNSKSDKDVQKHQQQRDYLLKPNVVAAAAAETNSYVQNYNNGENKNNRPPSSHSLDPNSKVPVVKHEQQQVRRHDDKLYNVKSDNSSNDVKRQQSVPGHDRNNVFLNKLNSTSQKVKSPFTTDTSKSVPPKASAPPQAANHPGVKQHHHNGNSSYNMIPIRDGMVLKDELLPAMKEETATTLSTNQIKRPSLFSPEKSPPLKTSPLKQSESLSPLHSPPPSGRRVRNYSTGSEPELRPVMKKIDQVEGFENLMRDSSIGINKLHQVPDIITPISDKEKPDEPALSYSKEMKPPDIIPPLNSDNNISTSQPLVNGIETNPMLISSLLKEAPALPHLYVGPNSAPKLEQQNQVDAVSKDNSKDHHHHKSKKKNKEKHKHKDKSREEKEKKKKHKDKDREKHRHKDKPADGMVEVPPSSVAAVATTIAAEPIKIKIKKDKIQPLPNPTPLKIKIPKDVIKTENLGVEQTVAAVAPPSINLKIKIPKEVIGNCEQVERSRKRERDRNNDGGPPGKMSRSGGHHRDGAAGKQNGRHNYNKVTQQGDGDTTIHRLAESKYTNKSSS